MTRIPNRPNTVGSLQRRRLLQFPVCAALALAGSGLQRRALAQGLLRAGISEAYTGLFHIGAAVSSFTLDRQIPDHLDLLAREFNSLTPENCMKWAEIRPALESWNWQTADRLVDFSDEHGMYLVGHTLVWHSQVPRTVFQDDAGEPLSRTALLARMEEHVDTLAGRYRGRIAAWDVVNEAVDEGNGWRRSPWFNQVGEDFMEQAFRFAHAADPGARLLYNDYNMHNPQKRAFLLNVLRDYLERDVPIHGVGLQGHIGLDYPDMAEWERSIAAYAELGLEVHITELDIDVLPSPYQMSAEISNRFEYSAANDPYRDGLPAEIGERLAQRYEEVFRMLARYLPQVKRVSLWGLHDGISWKNDFPIDGRTNYPLLFDRNLQRKPAHARLVRLAEELRA